MDLECARLVFGSPPTVQMAGTLVQRVDATSSRRGGVPQYGVV